MKKDLDEEKILLQAILDSTRNKLAQATLVNADLEALLAIEKRKLAELQNTISYTKESKND